MISRAQRILFIVMLVAAVTMAAILIRLHERARDRLQSLQDEAPMTEPVSAPQESVALLIPNDTDGSLVETRRSLPMPHDESARARVVIETLLHAFREPKSTHPIAAPGSQSDGTGAGKEQAQSNQAGSAASDGSVSRDLDEIFLMPIPQPKGLPAAKGEMAVVDLSAGFAASHPSGIEPETLTLLAILGTLHDNLSEVTQVRFLVDGHEKDTLAGHADLTRVYIASDTATGAQ
jgi:hypothetical protein